MENDVQSFNGFVIISKSFWISEVTYKILSQFFGCLFASVLTTLRLSYTDLYGTPKKSGTRLEVKGGVTVLPIDLVETGPVIYTLKSGHQSIK